MMMLSELKNRARTFRPLYRTIHRMRGNRIHEPARSLSGARRIGSNYGGWVVDVSRLNPGSVVYAVGVGEDVSFDLGLINAVGCDVHAFDPTPAAVDWIARQRLPQSFHFYALALGARDGEAIFHRPQTEGHASYSLTAAPTAKDRGTVSCPIRRLGTIMRDLGHDRLDLLKMDIEGFEYEVIDDMLATGILPEQLLVEFHHSMYAHVAADTKRAVNHLTAAGYELFWVSDVGHEYAFVRSSRDAAR